MCILPSFYIVYYNNLYLGFPKAFDKNEEIAVILQGIPVQ